MPLARTAADKLMMRGQSVTLENIGKTVTDGFEKVSNNVNDYMSSDKPRSFLQKTSGLVCRCGRFHPQIPGHTDRNHPATAIIARCLYIGRRHLCPYCRRHRLPISIVAVRGQSDSGSTYFIGHHGMHRIHSTDWHSYFCPGICNLHATIQSQPLPNTAKWTLLILWLVSVVLCVIYFYRTGINGWSTLPWYNFFNI